LLLFVSFLPHRLLPQLDDLAATGEAGLGSSIGSSATANRSSVLLFESPDFVLLSFVSSFDAAPFFSLLSFEVDFFVMLENGSSAGGGGSSKSSSALSAAAVSSGGGSGGLGNVSTPFFPAFLLFLPT